MTIKQIHTLCGSGVMRWTNHVVVRMLQRGITTDDVVSGLMNGEIIEQYLDDYPFPSCLVLGICLHESPLHIVCGASETELWIITAYRPNGIEWEPGNRVRKEKTL